METFDDYRYKRPDLGELEQKFSELLNQFQQAVDLERQDRMMQEISVLRNFFESMEALVHIRHSMDTTDPYYEGENDYLDEVRPLYEGLVNRYYQVLLDSKFREELEEKWGSQLFRVAELKLKTFAPEVIADLQLENKLVSRYIKLRASAKIEFQGKVYNLPQMEPFLEATEREVRQAAQEAFTGFFAEHEQEFDEIFDGLVKIRHQIAQKLGFKNFVALGYARMSRSDYDAQQVAGYRDQVAQTVVPLVSQLRELQAQRLGVDRLKYYDEPLNFAAGNPVPQGTPEEILANGKRMYREISPETGEFFDFMVEHKLLDLVARSGKAGGGYCTYINDYQSPFIFANFNGTSGDVDVLTHEAGHAFQVYCSREFQLPEYIWPTMEACEIHSMSMEFLAWPWMERFFGEQAEQYREAHLTGAVTFIPYGVTVDEFQHWVYEYPEATPEERKTAWRQIEKKYLPDRDYENNDLLNRGGYWFRQGHIFEVPFYYIDYTLAQVCALQFWIKSRKNPGTAWEDYLCLCRAGGSKSFLELVELAGLNNPFVSGCISRILPEIRKYLKL